MALGLTHPLKEMSKTLVSWEDKGGRCVGLTNYNLTLPCVDSLEIFWEPKFVEL